MARHKERHYSHRTGWIRASVLGANDGIISTAALILGVAAADSSRTAILTAGVAGLTAGALSMGLGEFVSVSSQRDTEEADIAKKSGNSSTLPNENWPSSPPSTKRKVSSTTLLAKSPSNSRPTTLLKHI